MTTPPKSELDAARERLEALADVPSNVVISRGGVLYAARYVEVSDLRLVLDALREARAQVESRDMMIETLQRALGPDKVMEAFGFDRERIENARRQIAEGKFITLEQLKAEIAAKERAAAQEAHRE